MNREELKALAMTNSEQALRDFVEKQFPLSKELKKEVLYNQMQQAKQNECLSDLTALISDGYYPKEFVEWFRSDAFFSEFNEGIDNDDVCYWEDTHSDLIITSIDDLCTYWKEDRK